MAKEKKIKEKEVNEHPNKIGARDVAGYTTAEAANMFNLTYITSYLKIFMTDVLKIKPKLVGYMFIVTRLWDVINDPLWGIVVAKRKPGKDGKFLQYLRLVAVPLGISTVLCFLPYSDPNSLFYSPALANNPTLLFAVCIVMYLIYCTMYTAMNIPFGSLASVITDDPKGRNVLSTARSLGSGVGGAVVTLIAPFIIYVGTGVMDEQTGKEIEVADGNRMFIYALIMGAMSIAFYLIGHRNLKERVPAFDEEKVDFKKTYLGLFKSRPFVMITISGVLISGQLQFNSFNSYLYKNYFTNTGLSVLGTICTYLPMAVLILFTPKLAAKYGKKELCGRMSIISAITSVFLAVTANNQDFIMWINPQQGIYPAWLFMACLLLIGFGYTFVSLTCWAVVMDVIDYQEWKTGERNESAVYSAYTFGRQLGQAIADAGGLFLLQWAKYDSETAGNGFIAANGTSNKIMFICTIIPAVVYVGVWLIFKFGYPLTKERLEPIYSDLRAKHEAEEKAAATK
ncbi:MAG: MFS transporter [Clostridia bacterium]|nr:MFS transporter [Clostridia bacterium]